MRGISRRAILTTGMKAGTGLVAFVPAIKALASTPALAGSNGSTVAAPPVGIPAPPPPSGPLSPRQVIAKFARGTVTSASESQLVITAIQGSLATTIALKLQPSTQVWKGGWNSGLPIEAGDEASAWGERIAAEPVNLVETTWWRN